MTRFDPSRSTLILWLTFKFAVCATTFCFMMQSFSIHYKILASVLKSKIFCCLHHILPWRILVLRLTFLSKLIAVCVTNRTDRTRTCNLRPPKRICFNSLLESRTGFIKYVALPIELPPYDNNKDIIIVFQIPDLRIELSWPEDEGFTVLPTSIVV